MRGLRALLVIVLLVAAGCGSDSKGSDGDTGGGEASTAPPAQDTSNGRGVTDDAVKIGVSLIKFDCISQFIDTIRIDQEHYFQAFADDINKNGGIGGRKVELVQRSFCPIDAGVANTACTYFTEDAEVFAVIGLIYDPTGGGQACVAKEHNTPLLTYLVSQAIIDKAPPGLMILAGSTQERNDAVIVKLLKEQNTLAGKKVAILAGAANKKAVETALEPGLESLGIPMGTTALLNIDTSGDTASAQAQLDGFIERWKNEDVTAVFATGDEAVSKTFIGKLREQMPDVTLLSDTFTVLMNARDETKAGKNPNPYEGIINVYGLTPEEFAQHESWTYCADIYEKETGKNATGPTEIVTQGDQTIDVHSAITDACTLMSLLDTIGDKAGQHLNNTTWVNAVNTLGPFTARGQGEFASLHEGKYDMSDTFRLVAFDSSLGESGDYRPLSPVQNIPG
jgi:ABC-type branched-subunit amino acid transport system substrate-binding protein